MCLVKYSVPHIIWFRYGTEDRERRQNISEGLEGGGSQNFCVQELTLLFNMFRNATSVTLFAVHVVLCEVTVY